MNAKELTFRGHEKTVLYACGLCGSLHSPKVYAAREDIADATARDSAEKCCMRTECACGRVTNWVMCGHDAVADSDDDTPQPAPDAVARLVEAAEFFDRRRKSIENDVSSGHSGRGPGASSWMREDDSDFRLDLRNAFDALSSALAAFKEVRDE